MKLIPIKILISFLVFSLGMPLNAATKKEAEEQINACEALFAQAQKDREKIAKLKPRFFSSKKFKEEFNADKAVHLKAFDAAFTNLIKVTNEKINIRTAATTRDRNQRLFGYTNRCTQTGEALAELTALAVDGTPPSTHSLLVNTWVNQARCGKFKCP